MKQIAANLRLIFYKTYLVAIGVLKPDVPGCIEVALPNPSALINKNAVALMAVGLSDSVSPSHGHCVWVLTDRAGHLLGIEKAGSLILASMNRNGE